MFIPPQRYTDALQKEHDTSVSAIRMKSGHVQIDQKIAQEVFGDEHNVCLVYYPAQHSLLIAPASDALFKQVHKTSQHILKDRNHLGDKSIALHELLIDNQIEDSDRDLSYELQSGLGIINIKLQ